jgi:hypothetical protein
MPLDTSIITQGYRPTVALQDPQEIQQRALTLQNLGLQNATAQQAYNDDLATRAAYQQAGGDSARLSDLLRQGGQYKADIAAQKAGLDAMKTRADTTLSYAHAGNFAQQTADTQQKMQNTVEDRHLQELQGVRSPAELVQWMQGSAAQGTLDPQKVNQVAQTLQADPTQFEPIRQGMLAKGIAVQEAFKQQQENARNAATNTTSTANNANTNAAHLRGIGMQQVGENVRMGFGPAGTSTPEIDTVANAIANGQLPPPTGQALLNPKNQRILSRVMEINPGYDFTDISAKKDAASKFTGGQLGTAMQAFAVAGQHLDQLGGLADALNNRDPQMWNKFANSYQQATGSPAPTNFDAVKAIASKEVMKAIVANGGGQSEREEMAHLLDKAQSPQQIQGVISQMRDLMAANHDALLTRRRAAGLRDSTLPDYGANLAAPAAGSPKVGAVDNGYVFLGGNPSDPKAWKKQ